MPTRRHFLAAALSAGAIPTLTWADAGSPDYLAAARLPDDTYALSGLTRSGIETFSIPLPARGHAAAAHPLRPEAVAFARRPGTFGLVIDCALGRVTHRITAPANHHFSGHGTFSRDAQTLFTGEIDNVTGQGQIGRWQTASYRRIGVFGSGGIGPHEILRLPGTDTLVVANGGIITALDDERSKLNIATMAPNLTYLDAGGTVIDQISLAPDLHQNSIRHLAALDDGTVAFAMQWEGEAGLVPPLLGLNRIGEPVVLCDVPAAVASQLQGYAGSVAFSGDGRSVAITCPHGGLLARFTCDGAFIDTLARTEVCGIGPGTTGFVTTDGLGGMLAIGAGVRPLASFGKSWDNHLIPLSGLV